jgi:hypothetical protein
MLLNQLQKQKQPAQVQGRRSSRDLGSGDHAAAAARARAQFPPSPSGLRPQPGFTALPPPPALQRSSSAGAAAGSAAGGGSSSSLLGLPPRANTLGAPAHTYAEAAAPPPSAPPPSAPPPSAPPPSGPPPSAPPPSAPAPSAPPPSAPAPSVMREPSEEERQRASAAQARLAARGKEEARARAVSAADEAAGAALREVLGQVGEGAYAGEGLLGHVVLGTMYLLCTELRVLLLRTGTWALLWQAVMPRRAPRRPAPPHPAAPRPAAPPRRAAPRRAARCRPARPAATQPKWPGRTFPLQVPWRRTKHTLSPPKWPNALLPCNSCAGAVAAHQGVAAAARTWARAAHVAPRAGLGLLRRPAQPQHRVLPPRRPHPRTQHAGDDPRDTPPEARLSIAWPRATPPLRLKAPPRMCVVSHRLAPWGGGVAWRVEAAARLAGAWTHAQTRRRAATVLLLYSQSFICTRVLEGGA